MVWRGRKGKAGKVDWNAVGLVENGGERAFVSGVVVGNKNGNEGEKGRTGGEGVREAGA